MTNEEAIEIPFGAKDSELNSWEYKIPDGYVAEIKGGKIIVRKTGSKDEKIRVAIIEVVKALSTKWLETFGISKDEILAYLERQKEPKPGTTKDNPINPFDTKLFQDGMKEGRRLEREEQKPAEWEDEYREEDLQTRFAFYTYKNEPDVLYLSNLFVEEASRNKGLGTKILNAAEDVAEDIGANKIRLMVKWDSPVKIWYHKHGYTHFAHAGKYDWLEKSLNTEPNEEFIPIEDTLEYKSGFKAGQKSVGHTEWSEEDERIMGRIQMILEFFDSNYPADMSSEDFPKYIDWLKTLRPQSRQEWSEEDEEELQNAIDCLEYLGNGGVYASESGYDAAKNAAKWLRSLYP